MGIECCSMTEKACVGGSWSRDVLPSEKQLTQRSKSLQASSAQWIRTYAISEWYFGVYAEAKAGLGATKKHGVMRLTVDVISIEQTSQMYFSPPSVPLEMVFFRITPILRKYDREQWYLEGRRIDRYYRGGSCSSLCGSRMPPESFCHSYILM